MELLSGSEWLHHEGLTDSGALAVYNKSLSAANELYLVFDISHFVYDCIRAFPKRCEILYCCSTLPMSIYITNAEWYCGIEFIV